jgi:hypothetical protein
MYVDVIFTNGKTGRILRTEYEIAKDKGYIAGLASENKPEVKEQKAKPETKEKKQKAQTK